MRCPKCQRPLSIFFTRDYQKKYAPDWQARLLNDPNHYIQRDFDEIVIKAQCPEHGPFQAKFNANIKEAWIDNYYRAVLQCMKCEEQGLITDIQNKKEWVFFRINCPKHGLTEIKKIVTPIFSIINELYENKNKNE